jgi:16S rRNA (cytosine1402-N4)-methyltransferase
MNPPHYPVMSREVTEILAGGEGDLYVDCTVGGGGHSRALLERLPKARLLALDVDPSSIEAARTALAPFADRVTFEQGNFIERFASLDLRHRSVAGVLVDPGLSMGQLKGDGRGFSHSLDAELDMRKDPSAGPTAADVLGTATEAQLTDIFARFGELERPGFLAKKIVERRLFQPLQTTADLRRLVEQAYHWRPQPGRLHPAARVFQALRIFVNRELEGLGEWIAGLPERLPAGVRVVFLTYHSLEDRLVKNGFRLLQQAGRMLIMKPFPGRPTEAEVQANPPSRSARLRAGVLA